MTSSTRETARDALTTLLQAALVGAGLPAQSVYGYQIGDFEGASPVVTVSSGPNRRELQRMGPCWTTTTTLHVHVFVLYSDGDTWGEDDAEDALDDIEALIADVVLANRSTANWDKLSYAEATQPGGVVIGGLEYRMEYIPLQCELRENG